MKGDPGMEGEGNLKEDVHGLDLLSQDSHPQSQYGVDTDDNGQIKDACDFCGHPGATLMYLITLITLNINHNHPNNPYFSAAASATKKYTTLTGSLRILARKN